jgi:hypothetical protein
MAIKKIEEFRPQPCGTRVGDVVEIDGVQYLQVKCRLCTKLHGSGENVYHYFRPTEFSEGAENHK